ncbi:MAG: SemiSWEET transporter [Candidatus Rickettsiella isopodorum]|jgi:MtN3 and saliva related transmembrane protein|nr:SemiSWEET transporter [Candidatus Rickettsiella isopodorum]MDD5162285.1 SemiSWEET transporter [Candidatus Rickettsiella isopodorum]
MSNYTEVIGLVAGVCTTIAFLPQVIQVWKLRSARDISLGMYIVFCFGVLLWLIYGFLIFSFSLILANLITFILAFIILLMKIIWS